MTDDAEVLDPGTCTFTFDELDVRKRFQSITECSRPVWGGADESRCVWHADVADKPPEELVNTVEDGTLVGAHARESDLKKVSFPEEPILRGVNLSGADIKVTDLSGADLEAADLSGADLRFSDLSEARLLNADLSGANLKEANLSGATLKDADLHKANLVSTDLSGANLLSADLRKSILFVANLSEADLLNADLANADLRGADLTDANLGEAKLSGVTLSRDTQCDDLPELRADATAVDDPADAWDRVARTYHALKTALAANGLIGRARDYHFLERDAREREAKAAEGWWSQAHLGSKASRYLTGYGVRPTRVGLLMVMLFGIATVAYLLDPGIENSLSYSVVTFTTSPPHGKLPTHPVAQGIALFETFVGTLLIVLLGYVLGNRERF